MTKSNTWFAAGCLAASCLAATWTSTATAQTPDLSPGSNYIYNNPRVSPYLNLLQTNQFGVPNIPYYQTQVRPQIEQRQQILQQNQSLQQLQSQVNSAQNGPRRGGNSGLSTTGHPSRFFNYSHYFPQNRNNRFSR